MREIKFKAWLLEENRMINPVIGFDLADKYIQWYEDEHEALSSNCSDCPLEKAVILQYTGLKDKNGVEIYEGDIAEQRYQNPLAGKETVERYKIETTENSLIRMFHTTGKQQWDRYLWMHYTEIEVIGNIYESPEMIEKV